MLVGRKFNWSHRPSGCTSRDKQIYYEVFHANKNHFVGSLHLPLIDAYQCLKLSDDFSRELGSSHSLGNLNVKQSKQCIENMRDNGHIRENHSDLTGGDCQKLLSEKCKLTFDIEGISDTFTALRPMAVAAVHGTSPATKTHAKKAFLVFHELYELFAAAAHLRSTINKWGDFSVEHQALVEKFFRLLHAKVNSNLIPKMKAGLSYMTWPCHYIAEHMSIDMRAWAQMTGGIPFGRSSNQVTEHMNKVIKRTLKQHTNSHVSGTNKRQSKFRQALCWIGATRLRRSEVTARKIRKSPPCPFCVRRNIVLGPSNMHSRRNSRKCNPIDRIERKSTNLGRALGESESDSGLDSGSDPEMPPESEADSE
jgi:hypothetical protein